MYLFCYERILVCKDSSFPLKEKEKTMKYPTTCGRNLYLLVA
ncbi:hypothetical protein BACINT_01506 [Bacteroides intestinalis DSM 17393]|uniref:Uncharacterized protein n=1 Tax=Bacteroides intestinalis DSM 17393 TaxID=471870 RepID=B3CAJ1_9BACE|nr:hypothetical protein BACINT_01506 [Bacteroides intestinalis DSM 17393]